MVSSGVFYAFTLGMLAAVNPCGFPLLPAYLDLFTRGSRREDTVGRVVKAVSAGAWCTVGFVALFGLFGVVVEAGWSVLSAHLVNGARYVLVGLGALMVLAGVLALLGRSVRLHLPSLGSGRGLPRPLALGTFGVSYGLASLGCALPLFVSGVATSFNQAGYAHGIVVFVAYALGMGSVLAAVAVAVALLGRAAAGPLRRLSRFVPRLGGVLLLAIGGYLVWYWTEEILTSTVNNPVERLVTDVQQWIASFVNAHAVGVGTVLGVVVVGAVVIGALAEHRRHAKPGPAGRQAPPATVDVDVRADAAAVR